MEPSAREALVTSFGYVAASIALIVALSVAGISFSNLAIIHDVNRRLHVISDINRAINTEFNKQGIEIPFPQRDINFRGPLKMEAGSTAPPQAPNDGESSQK